MSGETFLIALFIEVVGLFLWIKFLLWLNPEESPKKKNFEIKFDTENYPFGSGEMVDYHKFD